MTSLPDFLVVISKNVKSPQKSAEEMFIVIQRAFAQLQEELDKAFTGQSEVQVIVDKRYVDRRVTARPVQIEHRRTDRRSLKQKMVDVLIHI